MKIIKIQFADNKNKIQVHAADNINEVLSNLEFDPYGVHQLNDLLNLNDLVNEINDDGHPDIITGMKTFECDDKENDFSWIFSIGKVNEINKQDLDDSNYKYKYFITEDKEIYVYYSLCE